MLDLLIDLLINDVKHKQKFLSPQTKYKTLRGS